MRQESWSLKQNESSIKLYMSHEHYSDSCPTCTVLMSSMMQNSIFSGFRVYGELFQLRNLTHVQPKGSAPSINSYLRMHPNGCSLSVNSSVSSMAISKGRKVLLVTRQ